MRYIGYAAALALALATGAKIAGTSSGNQDAVASKSVLKAGCMRVGVGSGMDILVKKMAPAEGLDEALKPLAEAQAEKLVEEFGNAGIVLTPSERGQLKKQVVGGAPNGHLSFPPGLFDIPVVICPTGEEKSPTRGNGRGTGNSFEGLDRIN